MQTGDVLSMGEQGRYDELVYERRAALLELECVTARRQVFDVEEVLEENRALREQLAAMHAERVLRAATEADRAEEARRDVARYKNQLEEELRKKWRASEAELRKEAIDALEGEARKALEDRDAFHAYRRQVQRDVETVATGAAAMAARCTAAASERDAATEMAEAHARRAVELRARMKRVLDANRELESRLARQTEAAAAGGAASAPAREGREGQPEASKGAAIEAFPEEACLEEARLEGDRGGGGIAHARAGAAASETSGQSEAGAALGGIAEGSFEGDAAWSEGGEEDDGERTELGFTVADFEEADAIISEEEKEATRGVYGRRKEAGVVGGVASSRPLSAAPHAGASSPVSAAARPRSAAASTGWQSASAAPRASSDRSAVLESGQTPAAPSSDERRRRESSASEARRWQREAEARIRSAEAADRAEGTAAASRPAPNWEAAWRSRPSRPHVTPMTGPEAAAVNSSRPVSAPHAAARDASSSASTRPASAVVASSAGSARRVPSSAAGFHSASGRVVNRRPEAEGEPSRAARDAAGSPQQQPRKTHRRPLSADVLAAGAGLAGKRASIHRGASTAAAAASASEQMLTAQHATTPYALEGIDETGWTETVRGATGMPIVTPGFMPTPAACTNRERIAAWSGGGGTNAGAASTKPRPYSALGLTTARPHVTPRRVEVDVTRARPATAKYPGRSSGADAGRRRPASAAAAGSRGGGYGEFGRLPGALAPRTPTTYTEWGASLSDRRRGARGVFHQEVRFMRQSHNFTRGGAIFNT